MTLTKGKHFQPKLLKLSQSLIKSKTPVMMMRQVDRKSRRWEGSEHTHVLMSQNIMMCLSLD